MRSVALAAAILVSTALRDEIGRFELQVGENEQDEKSAKAAIDVNPTLGEEHAGDPDGQAISIDSCIDGVLHLRGTTVVHEELIFPQDCTVLRGEPGSEVILTGSKGLVFQGDLYIQGDLRFRAVHSLRGACLTIQQRAGVTGHIRFQNCHNKYKAVGHEDRNLEQGGALHVVKFLKTTGVMEFHNCTASYQGGGLWVQKMTQQSGVMRFQDCWAHIGGGLHVETRIKQLDGTLEFHNCLSSFRGGGLVAAQFLQQQGALRFHQGSSSQGGCFYVGFLEQHSGDIQLHNCESKRDGGCLVVESEMTQHNGTMRFYNCQSGRDGGGLIAGKLSQSNGSIEFENCRSGLVGGGCFTRWFVQHSGTFGFHNCSASLRGGGLGVEKEMLQNDGKIEFHHCSSGTGGGLHVRDRMTQNDGSFEFRDCQSEESGGGLFAESMEQNNGSITFHHCSSKHGGGAYVHDMQQSGTMDFEQCSSSSGGGMYVDGSYDLKSAGTAVFSHCEASSDGGGLWVKRCAAAGRLAFHHCGATRGGGLLAVTMNATELQLHHCRANESGGGMQITGSKGLTLDTVRFENCTAARATAMEARQVTVKLLELRDTFDSAILAQGLKLSAATFHATAGLPPTLSMEAGSIEIDSELDCTALRECRLLAPEPKLPGLRCGLGAGVATTAPFGCVACAEGYTQVQNVTSGACLPCPAGAALCHAARIQMKPGFMLHEGNLSRPLHCPTQAACPGGELPVSNERTAMCKRGYGDEGCAKCVEDNGTLYLMADANVLACTACAKTSPQQFFQWCSFLGQRAILFAVSAASIFGAGRADRVKNSGVYLNQLMAFAAVSGSVVTAVMQTETAQMMKSAAVENLYGAAVFLSDASSGQGAKSSHCLLSYLSLEQSGTFGVHCLDVAVASLLVLILSFKDLRVALVAGLNCFLPSIMADFAKYAVCYRLDEDQGDLICNQLPFKGILGFVMVAVGFLTVFAGALFLWIRLSSSAAEVSKDVELPCHVAFLTNKYGEGWSYFETERLVRKVLLATAAAFFPSTTSPALQLTALTVVTCFSIFLYGVFHPYRQRLWNWSELGLLITALLLISLASAVIENEDQWDKTDAFQTSMIITLGVIVTLVCITFIIKIILEIWHERRESN